MIYKALKQHSVKIKQKINEPFEESNFTRHHNKRL